MLQIKNLTQQYTMGATALCDISVTVKTNALLCVLGKTEAGKTSLLKTLCGLTDIKHGEILLNGTHINRSSLKELDIALMHENGGFFENKTILYNLEYPLKIRKLCPEIIRKQINYVITKFNLNDVKYFKVLRLNKIERLNLSFARLFLRNLSLILIDNPFKNFENRDELFELYLPYIKELTSNASVIYATDSAYEAYKLNGDTLVLNYGIVQQYDKYENLKNNPKTLTVMNYVNPSNKIFEASIIMCDNNIFVSYNNALKEIKKDKLLNDIYIGKKVIVAEVYEGTKSTLKIFDYNSERIIYFN